MEKIYNVNEQMIKLIRLLREKDQSLDPRIPAYKYGNPDIKAQITDCLNAHNQLVLSSGFRGTFRDEVTFSKRDLNILNAPSFPTASQNHQKFWEGEIIWDYHADEEGLHHLNWYYYRIFITDEEAEEKYPIWTWLRPWHMNADILGENSGHANDKQLGMLYDRAQEHMREIAADIEIANAGY